MRLDHYAQQAGGNVSLSAFFEIAIRLTEAVGALHQKRILHKEIAPARIFVNPEEGWLKLTEPANPLDWSELAAYMAPEQTGRMDRQIDARTDLYAMGVTFYELLTGRLPFEAADPVALMHCHLTVPAQAPSAVKEGIPDVISQMVLKCLAKNPEDRYQSAFGLLHDLKVCSEAWQNQGHLPDFALGQADGVDQLHMTNRLHGREAAWAAFREAVERVMAGGSECIFLRGNAGIGKTSLVREIGRSLLQPQRQAFYAGGKFEQFGRSVPYDAWIQVLRQLIRQVLTESETDLEAWKERIAQAVGANGQLLIQVVPEMELIIGPQPAPPVLPTVESQRRFQLLLRNLIEIFASKERPLVLFLDDLQWADQASLHLLRFFFVEQPLANLLVIGGYREQEAEERLTSLIDELREKGVSQQEIVLTSLTNSQVHAMVADILRCEKETVEPLVREIMRKTDGNPFFIKQFLETLHQKGHLFWDYETEGWRFHADAIREMTASGDIVDFMMDKILQLPFSAQEVLKMAACIGAKFDLKPLLLVVEQQEPSIKDALLRLLEDGLIVPVGSGYLWLDGGERPENVWFAFSHDRVQQAAYQLLAEDVQRQVHARLGRWMCENALEKDHLFEIVHHLNEGREFLTTKAEREEAARLNGQACKRAKASIAYEFALDYAQRAIQFLADAGCGWESDYVSLFALHLEWMELEYLCGNLEQAHDLFDLLTRQALTDEDKLATYIQRIRVLVNEQRGEEAARIGMEALRSTGFKGTFVATRFSLLKELLRVKWRLRKRTNDELLHAPAPDAKHTAWLELMRYIGHAAFFFHAEFSFLTQMYGLNLSLSCGNDWQTAGFYGAYGMVQGVLFQDYEAAYRYGQLGMEIERQHTRVETGGSFAARIMTTGLIGLYKDPLTACMERLKGLHQEALEWGDPFYAAHAQAYVMHHALTAGRPLDEVAREAERCYQLATRFQVQGIVEMAQIVRAMVRNLRGESGEPGELHHEDFEEADFRDLLQKDPYTDAAGTYHHAKAFLYHLAGLYERAAKHLRILVRDPKLSNNFAGLLYRFKYALVLCALYPTGTAAQQRDSLQELKRIRKRLAKVAKFGPANFEHMRLLVEAEYQRVRGRVQEALDLYDRAIADGVENGFWQDVAMAYECAGNLYLRIGKPLIAKTYLSHAHQAFADWGAWSKVRQLEAQYPDVLTRQAEPATKETTVDHLAVARAAQAISEERVLQKLKEKMMQILLENAGAERGTLLFEVGAGWMPHDTEFSVSPAVVQYVARTGEALVLHDACNAELFAHFPSIRERQVKSLLCMPISHGGKRICLLYLENNLVTHAFTPERLEILHLLSAQFAISIVNASLYASLEEYNHKLEEKVRARTADLEAANQQLQRSMRETAEAWAEVAVLEDRTRIAHDMHDIVGHTLTTSIVLLEASKKLSEKDIALAMQKVEQAQGHIRTSLDEVRSAVRMIKNDITAMELGQALTKLMQQTQEQTGIQIEYDIDSLPELDAKWKKLFYHALQEGITNGIRHGGSTYFYFRFRYERACLHFELRDNGKGSDVIHYGFGLTAMKEKLERYGGTVQVVSNAGAGWTLQLTLPLGEALEDGTFETAARR